MGARDSGVAPAWPWPTPSSLKVLVGSAWNILGDQLCMDGDKILGRKLFLWSLWLSISLIALAVVLGTTSYLDILLFLCSRTQREPGPAQAAADSQPA